MKQVQKQRNRVIQELEGLCLQGICGSLSYTHPHTGPGPKPNFSQPCLLKCHCKFVQNICSYCISVCICACMLLFHMQYFLRGFICQPLGIILDYGSTVNHLVYICLFVVSIFFLHCIYSFLFEAVQDEVHSLNADQQSFAVKVLVEPSYLQFAHISSSRVTQPNSYFLPFLVHN